MKKQLDWRVGFCDSADDRPQEYIPATVPGAVQLDYAAAHQWPSYMHELNYTQYRWMEDKFWVYAAEFDATDLPAGRLTFVSKGIDYKFRLYANGVQRYAYEGMYHEVRVDLSDLIGSRITLEIVLYPVPKSTVGVQHPNTREEANQTTKPAVSYGWDFHPRLIPSGIWGDTYMEIGTAVKPAVSYTLSGDLCSVAVKLCADTRAPVRWCVTDPHGKEVFRGTKPKERFSLCDPLLWWCNGYGEPNLYRWQLWVTDSGETKLYEGRMGFRTVSLEMNEGGWNAGNFPKSRGCPPITLCLNGVSIFAKGTNWVAPEIFYGTLNEQRYAEQLSLIKAAHMNLVRCWGGAVVNKESFFDLCDQLGLLVWQEFPLGCNLYHATKPYMNLLCREASDIIDRVSGHACLALWCGGNELFNSWSGMTDQSLPLRLLNKLTLEKTPQIPFLATSPLMGMGHGGYRFTYPDGRNVIEVMPQSRRATAYAELGMPALANVETMRLAAERKSLFPMEANPVTITHHAFNAWGQGDNWSSVLDIEQYFGPSNTLEELVERGQYLQSVGLRFVVEEARRQKPHCSMILNWCFNEPWPCIANNSIVSYPNQLKGGYTGMALACRSVVASAAYRHLLYQAGEVLEFDLWLLNDGVSAVAGETVSVSVGLGCHCREHLLDWTFPDVAANTNCQGPTIRYPLPDVSDAATLTISLDCGEYSSEYVLLYRSPTFVPPTKKLLNI